MGSIEPINFFAYFAKFTQFSCLKKVWKPSIKSYKSAPVKSVGLVQKVYGFAVQFCLWFSWESSKVNTIGLYTYETRRDFIIEFLQSWFAIILQCTVIHSVSILGCLGQDRLYITKHCHYCHA